MLEQYPDELVQEAVHETVAESPYPPTPSDICKRIKAMSKLSQDNPEELWAMVCKAASRGIYNAEEEFNKLPVPCQRFIGSREMLKDLALLDSDIFNSVTKGQFMKRIDGLIVQEELRKTLPPELVALAASVADGMRMPVNRIEEQGAAPYWLENKEA
jgi:hypothetical protein